jgi:hypothetical protein
MARTGEHGDVVYFEVICEKVNVCLICRCNNCVWRTKCNENNNTNNEYEELCVYAL